MFTGSRQACEMLLNAGAKKEAADKDGLRGTVSSTALFLYSHTLVRPLASPSNLSSHFESTICPIRQVRFWENQTSTGIFWESQ